MKPLTPHPLQRSVALAVAASMLAPTFLMGCGSRQAAIPPPVDDSQGRMGRGAPAVQPPRQGMSTGKKVVLLVGAAALLYMYKKRVDGQNRAANVQYYRSESTGRIYYRDPKTHQAHWVTPPAQGFQVPENEVQQYGIPTDADGYNGRSGGRDVRTLIPTG